jgi:putative transposase
MLTYLDGCGTFNADKNTSLVIAQRAVPCIKGPMFTDNAKTFKSVTARNKKAVPQPLS